MTIRAMVPVECSICGHRWTTWAEEPRCLCGSEDVHLQYDAIPPPEGSARGMGGGGWRPDKEDGNVEG